MYHQCDGISRTAPAPGGFGSRRLRRLRSRRLRPRPRLATAAGRHARGRRMRRGDVRAAILLLLEEEPRNGYQVMQEIEQRSGGAWRPSPGSVYPALPAARRRGPDPRRGARRRQRLRAHRRRPQPTSRRTASGSGRRGSRPARACPRACASSASCSMQVGVAVATGHARRQRGAGGGGRRGPRRDAALALPRSSPRTSRRDEPATSNRARPARRRRPGGAVDTRRERGVPDRLAYSPDATLTGAARGAGGWIDRLPPALQQRDYRLLWIALLVDGLGAQMVAVAVGWQVFAIRHSRVRPRPDRARGVRAAAAARAARRAARRPRLAPAARSRSRSRSRSSVTALLLVVTPRAARRSSGPSSCSRRPPGAPPRSRSPPARALPAVARRRSS